MNDWGCYSGSLSLLGMSSAGCWLVLDLLDGGAFPLSLGMKGG